MKAITKKRTKLKKKPLKKIQFYHQRYTWDDFWAFMVGAGVVYTFFVILDLVVDKTFQLWFFFLFWSIMFIVILFMRAIKNTLIDYHLLP
jgi:uncharacterized protein (DUF983 family)